MDVLHDGPVLEGLSLEKLSEVSADFIADCNSAVLEKAKNAFQKRDIVFRKCHECDEVVLWNSFELFDQLHIIQLLDGFAQTRNNFQHMSVIFVDDYLGRVSIESLPQCLEMIESVSKKQLVLGQLGWKVFPPRTLN